MLQTGLTVIAAPRTSLTHPLRIDGVGTPGGGRIGMSFCPGKVEAAGGWTRELGADLDAIRDWGAVAVVTLIGPEELERYRVAGMGAAVRARGMAWHHLPIVDYGIPGPAFETSWREAGSGLRAQLRGRGRILLHCLGGLGRTGMVAALLLAELGEAPEAAIRAVRQARPGAIETPAQEAYALAAMASDPVREGG